MLAGTRRCGRAVAVLCALLCALLILVAGCGAGVVGRARPAPNGAPGSTVNVDRDAQTVLGRLARLDACTLVPGPTVSPAGVRVIPRGPYRCMLKAADGRSLTVTIGRGILHDNRVTATPLTLAGARAYRTLIQASADIDVPVDSVACEILLPTSFTTGVTFELDGAPGGGCDALTTMVTGAVPAVDDPRPRVDASHRPGAGWIGCVLLGKLLGDQLPRYSLDTAQSVGDCTATPTTDQRAKAIGYQLEYAYWSPTDTATSFAGKPARVVPDGSLCTVEWKQGPSGFGDSRRLDREGAVDSVVVSLSELPCPQVPRLATQAAGLLNGAAPGANPGPLPHLTIPPGEPDEQVLGACVDFVVNTAEGCVPARPVPVPADPAKALATGDNDVTCAAFRDAVAAAFGPQYHPMNWGQHCIFASHDHQVQLIANLDPVDSAGAYGQNAGLDVDRRQTTVGRHPALEFSSSDHNDFDVYVAAGSDLNQPGNVHLEVEAQTPRGALDTGETRPALPAGQDDATRRAITAVVNRYFR